jgi:Domain of unknown function (DUF4178)
MAVVSDDAPDRQAAAPGVKGLNCPKCGASLSVRSFDHAVTIVCGSCHSILDAKDPQLRILQEFDSKSRLVRPLIPLGTRGQMHGTAYDVIGFQQRTIVVEGVHYSWQEYLLFNPLKGFRYLAEYDGHWNDATTLKSLPAATAGTSETLTCDGVMYKHFQTADAVTSFVLGEFPWAVRVGESAKVSDYVAPPRVISREVTGREATWSIGEYVQGRDIWKAFGLPGKPPAAVGIYANQPSPYGSIGAIWRPFLVLTVALLVLMIVLNSLALKARVFEHTYTFDTRKQQMDQHESSFVTDGFDLTGHTSNVELTTEASVSNNWIGVSYALINEDTGQAYDFGREMSHYSGRDEDGAWTEDSSRNVTLIPSVPPGRYYLRVEPDADAGPGSIRYKVILRRDVPNFLLYGLALLALAIPAGFATWRSMSFEQTRWAESDGSAPDIGSDS